MSLLQSALLFPLAFFHVSTSTGLLALHFFIQIYRSVKLGHASVLPKPAPQWHTEMKVITALNLYQQKPKSYYKYSPCAHVVPTSLKLASMCFTLLKPHCLILCYTKAMRRIHQQHDWSTPGFTVTNIFRTTTLIHLYHWVFLDRMQTGDCLEKFGHPHHCYFELLTKRQNPSL